MNVEISHVLLKKYRDGDIIIKVGKNNWMRLNLIKLISVQTGESTSSVRRLMKQNAIEYYLPIET